MSEPSTGDKVKAVVAAVVTVVGATMSTPSSDQQYARAEKLQKEQIVQELRNETAAKNKAKKSQDDD